MGLIPAQDRKRLGDGVDDGVDVRAVSFIWLMKGPVNSHTNESVTEQSNTAAIISLSDALGKYDGAPAWARPKWRARSRA
jgi:hypothetical protein